MDKRIAVIGAGAAGIASATKLIEHGFSNVTIIEAEKRTGGRLYTTPFGANVVDIGGQWCHGQQNNVVYEMAKEHNLLFPSKLNADNYHLTLRQSDGTKIPVEVGEKWLTLAGAILETNTEEMDSYKGSLGNFFMEKYRELLREQKCEDLEKDLCYHLPALFEKLQNSLDASFSWYETSCLSYSKYSKCEGDQSLNWGERGYSTVFDLLQKKIPENRNPIEISNHLTLGRTVRKIIYSDELGGVAQIKSTTDYNSDDYETLTVDHVICTVSLGVLKDRHLSLFEPTLTQSKINDIDGIAFGVVCKMFMEFEQAFWPDDWTGCTILWKPEQLKIIREDENMRWMEDVLAVYTVDGKPNVLLGWAISHGAIKMESLPLEIVTEKWIKLLRMVLNDFVVPDKMLNVKRSQWFSNPNFRGTYSYYSTKSDGFNASVAGIAAPILGKDDKPFILFAGEATSPDHFSTVHGAIETGWREAQRIIDWYNESDKTSTQTIS